MLDALVKRTYDAIVGKRNEIIENSTLPAIDRIELLFKSYKSF